MAENFNVNPYYDDFDPSKNYMRVLFKPEVGVQARELTQMQTILQNQISNFAANIFSQNTPVTGGKVTTNLKVFYIKLNQTYNNVNISAVAFLNRTIQNATGTVIAKVVAATESTGTTIGSGDPPTLIVTYLSGTHFTDNDTIYTTDGTNFIASVALSTIGNPSTGSSSVASISEGVFYIVNGYSQSNVQNPDGTYSKYSIGNFVNVLPQTTILDKYGNTPSYRIGLEIQENIVDYISDPSLLDPAIGASNYQAPGADRYQISLNLVTLPLTLGNDNNFIELARVQNGNVVRQVDGTVYSTINEYIAKRDYETNGDYIVNGFNLTPSANTITSDNYDLSIGKGVGYVRGYRVENQSDLVLTAPRARQTSNTNSSVFYIDYGNYFIVDTVTGVFDVTTMPQIDFHCVPSNQINSSTSNTYNSTLVGSAEIRNLNYISNTSDSNTLSYIFNAYVANVNFISLSGQSNTGTSSTITINDPNGNFSTVSNAYYGVVVTITSGTSAGDTRKIVSYNGTTKTFTVNSPFTLTPDSTSQFTFFYDQTVIESLKNPLASANINISGKVGGISTGDTIFENTSTPELLFSYGNPYVVNISNTSYISTKVFRNKTFTLAGGIPTVSLTIPTGSPLLFEGIGTLSPDAVKQNFIVINTSTGQILDMSSSGNNITISASQTTATLTSNTYLNDVVDVISTVYVSNADAVGTNPGLVLKAKNLITGNSTTLSTNFVPVSGTNTSIDLNLGQTYITGVQASQNTTFSLYVSDVRNIVKIIDTGNPSQTITASMLTSPINDVTRNFRLNNGQRDSFYDHATISLIAGAPAPKGNILIVYNYYQHSGGDGYFSVLSYLSPISVSPENYASILIYTAKSGTVYNLRDTIDFRPSRQNGVASFVFEYTGNPTVDDSGILIPKNLTNFVSNYSYYFGRKDIFVLSKDNSFSIIQGTPAKIPVYPTAPTGSMILAKIDLDPYTAYVPGEISGIPVTNLSLTKIPNNRWTKSDITDLQSRVNNIEYYQSLNLLEQNAQSLQIPDSNGLNRFKNGILVDNFTSYATADTGNPDFTANINIREQKLMPLQIVDNFQLQNPIVLTSLGTVSNTSSFSVYNINGTNSNIFTLPSTSNNAIVQPIASGSTSVNPFSVIVEQGTATLSPPMDNWVDNQAAAPVLVTDPNLSFYQKTNGVNVTNATDWVTIPGTTTTTSSTVQTGSSSTQISSQNGVLISPHVFDQATNTWVAPGKWANISTDSVTNYYSTNWSTTSQQLQNTTTSYNSYTPVGAGYSTTGNVIQNISILPYIRPQQIIFRCNGLLINTPVQTYFDGVNVDSLITAPDVLELTNVTGTFNRDDIIGYYTNNNFYATGRVVSTMTYSNSNNVRLYISKTNGAPVYATTGVIQNAQYDINGNYIGSTASGLWDPTTGSTLISMSGTITAVGGGYSPTNNGIYFRYSLTKDINSWGTFMNQYSVWSNGSFWWNISKTYSNSVPLSLISGGSFTITGASSGTSTVTIDGVTVLQTNSPVTPTTNIVNLTAGNHTLSWSSTDTAASWNHTCGFALTIADVNDNIVWDSRTPPQLTYANVAQEIVMTQGGAWFTGVTQLQLDNLSSNVQNYYVGSQINIVSKFVYDSSQLSSTPLPPNPTVTGADGTVPSGGPGSGGSTGQYKIICHKLHELGLMDDRTFEADQQFGYLLKTTKPTIYYGYIKWAKFIVKGMDNKYFANIVNIFAKPWAKHMSYLMGYSKNDNFIGRILMKLGTPICFIVGKLSGK